jgi:hypothetical protein
MISIREPFSPELNGCAAVPLPRSNRAISEPRLSAERNRLPLSAPMSMLAEEVPGPSHGDKSGVLPPARWRSRS